MARRAIVFAIDGLVLPLAEHFVREGRLPHFAHLFKEGALTKVLPFVSTWGPINWMCFATGAEEERCRPPRLLGRSRGRHPVHL